MIKIERIKMKQEEQLLCYQLFWHYYRGDLNQLTSADWIKLVQILRMQPNICLNHDVNKALMMLEEVNETTLQTFVYDYNRLFVGPHKLLASPYESSYRNFEGAVMQQETIKVRNFYYYGGLQVANEGQVPDDHIQFELEFILHLLTDSNNQEKKETYKLFLEKHLLQWGDKHCEQIQKNSRNDITFAMAVLLKGFLQLERMMMNTPAT